MRPAEAPENPGMEDPGVLLEVERLCRALPAPDSATTILRDVTFDLRRGEIVALLGMSGSGKTALLRTLAGLDAASGGDIRLSGVSAGGLDPREWRRRVALVPERPRLLGATAGEGIRRVLALRVHARRSAGATDPVPLLHRLRLGAEILGRAAAAVTPDESFRVALVRTLLCDPEVLLVDAPVRALDPEARQAVEALLRERTAAGAGVLVVASDDEQARRLAGRALILFEGAMHAFADTREVFRGERP